MFRVGRDHTGKPIYEVRSLEQAQMLAREHSRSLSRWMDEKSCWVSIYDPLGREVDTQNFYMPGQKRPKKL